MILYCCKCDKKVNADEVEGSVIYPHLPNLKDRKFYICGKCRNYVGTHKNSGTPLGSCIPTKEIRSARQHIHSLLDPLWKNGIIKRSELYKMMSKETGRNYHTGNIRSIEEAREVYRCALKIKKELTKPYQVVVR